MPLANIWKRFQGVHNSLFLKYFLKFLRYIMLFSKSIAFKYLFVKQNFFRHGAKFATNYYTIKFTTEVISMYIGRKKT